MIYSLEEAGFQKRSVNLQGHKTSISLEKAFWKVLEEAAHGQGLSLSQLIKEVDGSRQTNNLASVLRLYALAYALKSFPPLTAS